MTCQDCQNLIQQRLDGSDFPATAGLDRHLAECPACRQLHVAARQLEDGLRLLPAPIVPAGFSDRLVHQVLVQRRRRSQWKIAVTVSGLAAAAVIAILGIRYWPSPSSPPMPPVVVEKPREREPVPAAPSLRDSVADVGSAVAALARRTTEETVDHTRVLWVDPMANAQKSEPMPELDAQSLWEAGQSVSSGLEPVTTSARRAVGLFLRDLPPVTGTVMY